MTVVIRFQPGLKPVIEKHQSGTHDQESHGNWAGYPNELISRLGNLDNKARTDLYKKKIKMGIPTYAGNAHIDSPLIKQLLKTGEIKLTKTQIEELRVDQKNIDKLYDNRWKVEKQWYDDHFITKNNNPEDSLGMFPEILKIRDEYVAGVGNNDVMMATNRGLRKNGRVTSRVERFDQMVATGSVKESVILWRSAILPKEMVDSLEKGSSFIDKGFQSTGTTKNTAFSYAEIRYDQQKYEGVPVVFKMKVNKGVGAVDVGYGETVLQRNTRVSVTGIKSGPKINILSESAPFRAKGPAYVVVEVEVDKA
jgi:hypothetical protein